MTEVCSVKSPKYEWVNFPMIGKDAKLIKGNTYTFISNTPHQRESFLCSIPNIARGFSCWGQASGLVKISDTFSSVSTRPVLSNWPWTASRIQWYWMLMCLVRLLTWSVEPIMDMAELLLMKSEVGEVRGIWSLQAIVVTTQPATQHMKLNNIRIRQMRER